MEPLQSSIRARLSKFLGRRTESRKGTHSNHSDSNVPTRMCARSSFSAPSTTLNTTNTCAQRSTHPFTPIDKYMCTTVARASPNSLNGSSIPFERLSVHSPLSFEELHERGTIRESVCQPIPFRQDCGQGSRIEPPRSSEATRTSVYSRPSATSRASFLSRNSFFNRVPIESIFPTRLTSDVTTRQDACVSLPLTNPLNTSARYGHADHEMGPSATFVYNSPVVKPSTFTEHIPVEPPSVLNHAAVRNSNDSSSKESDDELPRFSDDESVQEDLDNEDVFNSPLNVQAHFNFLEVAFELVQLANKGTSTLTLKMEGACDGNSCVRDIPSMSQDHWKRRPIEIARDAILFLMHRTMPIDAEDNSHRPKIEHRIEWANQICWGGDASYDPSRDGPIHIKAYETIQSSACILDPNYENMTVADMYKLMQNYVCHVRDNLLYINPNASIHSLESLYENIRIETNQNSSVRMHLYFFVNAYNMSSKIPAL